MSARARRGQGVLLAWAGLSLAPILAAWWLYTAAPRLPSHSVGQLLATQRFAGADLVGWPLGAWSLVSIEAGACDAACQHRAFILRQIRLAQGEGAQRLERVLLRASGRNSKSGDLVSLTAPLLARSLARDGYFLIDPLGNQVMFYSDKAEPERVIREINRLMQVNNAL